MNKKQESPIKPEDLSEQLGNQSPMASQMSNAYMRQLLSNGGNQQALGQLRTALANSPAAQLLTQITSWLQSQNQTAEAESSEVSSPSAPAGPAGHPNTSEPGVSSPSAPGAPSQATTDAPDVSAPSTDTAQSGPNTDQPNVSAPAGNSPPEICAVHAWSTQIMYNESVEVYFNAKDKDWDPLTWEYNWSGGSSGSGEVTAPTPWIKIPLDMAEEGAQAGEEIKVEATVSDPYGQKDTDSLTLEVIGEPMKTWEVWFDTEDAKTAQRVDLVGDRTRQEEEDRRQEEQRRQQRSDPIILDLDGDGKLGTAAGTTTADGKIDGESVLFDMDPGRSSWAFVSSTDLPGVDAPAVQNGYAIYENGDRESIGPSGQWSPQTEGGGQYTHARARIFNASSQWVAEWIRVGDSSYDLFWGSREDKERTEWLQRGTGDGFLVWDHNGNGIIDDNTEMMSEFDVEGNEAFANGFEKLRHYFDKDGDGIVKGAELNGLKLWVDSDADAQTEAGELKELDEYGLTHIVIPEIGLMESTSTVGKVPTKGG
jgi:hypothetical protein